MDVAHGRSAGRLDGSGRESRELFSAYRSRRDTGARNRLVELHMPLVRTLARRYATRGGEPFEDLVQVGSIGLLHAIERFDPERGRDFACFAGPTIAGEIRHHLRDRAAIVRLPRRYPDSTARQPVLLSISDEAGARLALALAVEAPYDSSEDRLMLVAGLRTLTLRERRIMHLRFFAGLSQDEIARQVGLSQVQVSRLIRLALERMRGALAGSGSATLRPRSRVDA